MSLGDLVKKAVPTTSIKSMISKKFIEDRPLPPLRLEDDAYVRSSGLGYLCAREEIICNALNIDHRRNKFTSDSMLTLVHGTALHWAIQNKILPELNILLGQWSCLECGLKHGLPTGTQALEDFLIKRPAKCNNTKCNSTEFQYCELHFKDPDYRIGGHPDGFLKMDGLEGLGLLEVKSVNQENAIKALAGPFEEHIIQAHVYMWLTRVNWTKFIYWDKAGRGVSSIIEHTVNKDQKIIDEIKLFLKSLWDGIETKQLPTKPFLLDQKNENKAKIKVIDASNCPKAKKCIVSDICGKNKTFLEV